MDISLLDLDLARKLRVLSKICSFRSTPGTRRAGMWARFGFGKKEAEKTEPEQSRKKKSGKTAPAIKKSAKALPELIVAYPKAKVDGNGKVSKKSAKAQPEVIGDSPRAKGDGNGKVSKKTAKAQPEVIVDSPRAEVEEDTNSFPASPRASGSDGGKDTSADEAETPSPRADSAEGDAAEAEAEQDATEAEDVACPLPEGLTTACTATTKRRRKKLKKLNVKLSLGRQGAFDARLVSDLLLWILAALCPRICAQV